MSTTCPVPDEMPYKQRPDDPGPSRRALHATASPLVAGTLPRRKSGEFNAAIQPGSAEALAHPSVLPATVQTPQAVSGCPGPMG